MDIDAKELEEAKSFLKEDFPLMLAQLRPDAERQWGLMTPQHMVEHLIVVFKMSIGRINLPVVSPEEEHDRIRAYLIKDRPMRRSVPSPNGSNELQKLRSPDIESAKEKVLAEAEHFLNFVEEKPGFLANHPYGSPMTAEQWLLFHKKHIKHHFIQFAVIPDYE